MALTRLFVNGILKSGQELQLAADQARYLSRVLRLRAGDSLTVFNGDNGEFAATLSAVGKNSATVLVESHVETATESPLKVHLVQGISRGERMDYVVQKATELGVSAITPLRSERTEVRLSGERAEKKLRHWQQIATSACEQCGRNRLPNIQPAQDLAQWIGGVEADTRLVLHHRASSAQTDATSPSSSALLVGPEGGLSPEEITAAEQAQFRSLQLGPRILRTETAPLAAIAILQARWGDMAGT